MHAHCKKVWVIAVIFNCIPVVCVTHKLYNLNKKVVEKIFFQKASKSAFLVRFVISLMIHAPGVPWLHDNDGNPKNVAK